MRVNLVISKIFLKHLNLTQALKKIKKAINTTKKLPFPHVAEDEKRKFIMILDGSKASPIGDIPSDMLKQTINIRLPIMTQIISMSVDNYFYPDDLKLAEVIPVFKKKDDLDKKIIDLSVFYLMCHRSLVELCTNKYCQIF